MTWVARNVLSNIRAAFSGPAFVLVLGVTGATAVAADEEDAKSILRSMSDYVASQEAISFGYDASLEVITKDDQRLALVSSGTVSLKRPGSLRTTRSGGFADTETFFDGETLTLLG